MGYALPAYFLLWNCQRKYIIFYTYFSPKIRYIFNTSSWPENVNYQPVAEDAVDNSVEMSGPFCQWVWLPLKKKLTFSPLTAKYYSKKTLSLIYKDCGGCCGHSEGQQAECGSSYQFQADRKAQPSNVHRLGIKIFWSRKCIKNVPQNILF